MVTRVKLQGARILSLEPTGESRRKGVVAKMIEGGFEIPDDGNFRVVLARGSDNEDFLLDDRSDKELAFYESEGERAKKIKPGHSWPTELGAEITYLGPEKEV